MASLQLTRRPEVAYIEWLDPIFIGGHWTPELIELAGGRHSLNAPGQYSVRVWRAVGAGWAVIG